MNKKYFAYLFGFCALLVAVASPARSVVDAVFDPLLADRGWMEVNFDGKAPNSFRSCGESCIKVITMDSVSMISKSFPEKLADMPLLSWEWMLAQKAPRSDLSRKGMDDRAIAVYVAFPYDPKRASLAEVLFRPVVELFKGKNTPGRVISYVWNGNAKRGAFVESPYFGGHGIIKVVRNADDKPRTWFSEQVNVVEDFQKFFDDTPDAVSHILISSDSDDTGVVSMAYVRKITFQSLSAKKTE